MTSEKGQLGQYFEDFLKEQDTYESTTEQAVKRVLAYQLSEEIKSKHTQHLSLIHISEPTRPY